MTSPKVVRRKLAAGPALNLRESEVKQEITALLKRIGWQVWSTSDGRKSRNTPGLPDMWCMASNGRPPFWVEVKSETGKPSPEQESFAALCHHAGTGYVMGGVTQVLAYLKKIGAL